MDVLYRAYGYEHELLYIGISSNWVKRFDQHAENSQWFHETDYIRLQHFGTREAVKQAERLAIQHERPKYNVQYNVSVESIMDHAQKIKFWTYYEAPVDDEHKDLIFAMKEAIRTNKVDIRGRPMSVVALFLIEAGKHGYLGCHDCVRMRESAQVQDWAERGLDKMPDGEE
jgi:hypothetical protein